VEKGGYIYILTCKNHKVLYVGVTSQLRNRICEHKSGKYPNSFSSRYKLEILVYFETFFTIEEAIQREKQLKAGSRKKKLELIDDFNPKWLDLYDTIEDY
jgi:putative endonuclease